MQKQSFLQKRRHRQSLKQEFASLGDVVLTLQDAENVGYSPEWFEQALGPRAGHAGSVSIRDLGPALDNPDVVDLARYKIRVQELNRELAAFLETRFSPYDVVAAGVAGHSFLHVCRMLFPGEEAVALGALLPQIRRPVVAEFFGAATVPAIEARLEQIEQAADDRRKRIKEASFALDREIDLEDAAMSGAAEPGIRELAEVWFGKDATLNVQTLLMVPHVEAFAKLARWRMMMAAA